MSNQQLYFVEFDIVSYDEEMTRRIPEQHELLLRLMQSGAVTHFAVSAERDKLWVSFRVKDMHELLRIVSSFPLINYLRPKIYPLLFQEVAVRPTVPLSLN